MKSAVTLLCALVLIGTTGCGGGGRTTTATGSGSNSAPSSDTSSTPTQAGPQTPSTPSTPTTTSPGPSTTPTASGIPHSSHVFLIIEENQSFTTIYDNNGMPFLNSLAKYYAYADNYTSNSGGSMLDYLWLSSGSAESNFGCEGWGCPQTISDDNIFRQLTKAGLTWKIYAQSLPNVGFMGDGPYPYVKRHNPAVWYSDVVNSSELQKNVVPFSQLATDMANGAVPNYAVIIPDLQNDAHDGTPAQADAFLWSDVQPLFKQAMWTSSGDALMFITFDECASGTNAGCGAHVLTTVVGPQVKKGYVSKTAYTHANALRTIMEALGLKTFPGAAANAAPMADFFQ
jgi:phosphatidylinositol-3-phosphatase